jgi:hypothetical protein
VPSPGCGNVPGTEDWSIRYTDRGPVVSADTLISLRVPNPTNAMNDRWLPAEAHDTAPSDVLN